MLQVHGANHVFLALHRNRLQVQNEVGGATDFSSLGSRADDDLRVRATRNDHVAVRVENIVSNFRGISLALGGLGGINRVFGSYGNLGAIGHYISLGVNLGLRWMVMMLVHSVGRSGRRSPPAWCGSAPSVASRSRRT